jgi:hypothetical protein
MVTPYIEQLEALAREMGVDLAEAYIEAGYARNAYWRHVTGSVMVPLDAAFAIEAAMERLLQRKMGSVEEKVA